MDAHEASREAIHRAKDAQQAVETARELSQQELVERTAQATKESLIEGLKEVFGGSDGDNPQQMTVLIRRIPLLCTNIVAMHEALERTDANVKQINDNLTWGVRLVVGGVITTGLAIIYANLK